MSQTHLFQRLTETKWTKLGATLFLKAEKKSLGQFLVSAGLRSGWVAITDLQPVSFPLCPHDWKVHYESCCRCWWSKETEEAGRNFCSGEAREKSEVAGRSSQPTMLVPYRHFLIPQKSSHGTLSGQQHQATCPYKKRNFSLSPRTIKSSLGFFFSEINVINSICWKLVAI